MSHGITTNDQMFSVREVPWHGLGVVLDEYPKSIDEALDKAGLGWKVTHGDVLVVKAPEWTDDFGTKHPAELIPAKGFKANLREDTGDVLGIVSDEYEVVDNRDAFRFLDALIGSELHFETAGSLWGGRRVWVLARLPEYIELGGDQSATYVYVANSHDGSMAVTAAVTPIRIVCANTLGAALRQAEHGATRRADVPLPPHRQPAGQVRRGPAGARDDHQLPEAVQGAGRPARARANQRAHARATRAATPLGDRRREPRRARARENRERTIEQRARASSAAAASPATPPATAPAPSGRRSTRSPSTSTTAGATRRAPTRCSARSRTPRSSSGRSTSSSPPDTKGAIGWAPAGAPPGSQSSQVLRESHLVVTGPLPALA